MSTATITPAPVNAERLLTRINDVSTLPHVALQVIRVANDPNSGPADLKAVMESDVALTTRVLRLVNSSAYALRNRITNLQHAISYLGVKQIRNLAMAASVAKLFEKDETIGKYRRSEFWRHLVAVAACSRLMALRAGIADFEDFYLAGLLHDLGLIVADQHAHRPFVDLVTHIQEGQPTFEAELTYLGFSHTQIAGELARRWGFPAGTVAAIIYHHNSEACRDEHQRVVQIVEVANFLTALKGMTSLGMNCLRFPKAVIAELGLSKEDLLALSADLDRELQGNALLFP